MNTRERLKYYPDGRGLLGVLNKVPFEVKRLFIIDSVVNGTVRGAHAHKQCNQFLICMDGCINVHVWNGTIARNWSLIKGDVLLIDKKTWSHQQYFNNAKLLVLCSEEYDESDYIRDIDEFNEYVKQEKS